jgi:hypothetical protein
MTAALAEATPNNLACQIVREDGKPLTMSCSKTDCAIDGVRTLTVNPALGLLLGWISELIRAAVVRRFIPKRSQP